MAFLMNRMMTRCISQGNHNSNALLNKSFNSSVMKTQHLLTASTTASLSFSSSSSSSSAGSPPVFEDAESHKVAIDAWKARVGLESITNESLLTAALTHASVEPFPALTNEVAPPSQRRLEWLGDRTLSLVVANKLTSTHPNLPVSSLDSAQALYVNNNNLARVGKAIGIQDVLRWSPAPVQSLDEADASDPAQGPGGRVVANGVIASAVEAIIGALYMDGGIDAASTFIDTHIFNSELNVESLVRFAKPKVTLRYHAKAAGKSHPEYRLLSETGRYTHAPQFLVGVFVDGEMLGQAHARSIKAAEAGAALEALQAHYAVTIPAEANTAVSLPMN